jgi:hypothetical protein
MAPALAVIICWPKDIIGETTMALQLGALREALIEAGASADTASKAAEEVASYENRLAGVETKLVALDGKVSLLTWMVGFNLAMSATMLWHVFK